jgi:hypothetical protein
MWSLLLLITSTALAHGDHAHGHDQQPLAAGADADWATRHMVEEHHINSFDPGVFFQLHDYDGTNQWSPDDIRRTYGLFDKSTAHISEADKAAGVQKVLDLFDGDRSGTISYAEFTIGSSKGLQLPDLGFGPGHHGDDEYEYEIHHFEKYHSGDDVKEEDLTHPEDIEHFKMHEEMEKAQADWEQRERNAPHGVIDDNIPKKFLRT